MIDSPTVFDALEQARTTFNTTVTVLRCSINSTRLRPCLLHGRIIFIWLDPHNSLNSSPEASQAYVSSSAYLRKHLAEEERRGGGMDGGIVRLESTAFP